MNETNDASKQEPLDDLPRASSQLAYTAAVLAVAPPALAFMSALIGATPLFSLAFMVMYASVPGSLVLGLVAIVRAWNKPLHPGAGLGTLAVAVSGGILAFVFWFLGNFNPHY